MYLFNALHLFTVVNLFCGPADYILGERATTFEGTAAACYLSLYCWLTLCRVLWGYIGRLFGFYDAGKYWLFVILFPWRPVYAALLYVSRWWRSVSYRGPCAKWAGLLETLTLLYLPWRGHYFLGRAGFFQTGLLQPVGIPAKSHLAIIAGSGAGKTTALISQISQHQSSVFCVDPKGQIATAILDRCGYGTRGIVGKKHKTVLLDPQGIVKGHTTGAYNVIDEIEAAVKRHGPDAAVRFARKIAEGLIASDFSKDDYWTNTPRLFLTGVILYVYKYELRERRHLARVYDLVTNGLPDGCPAKQSPFMWLLFKMSKCPDFEGVISGAANLMLDAGERTRGALLTVVREQMGWLQQTEMRRVVSHSGFLAADLKIKPTDVFICGPVSDLKENLSGWVRTMAVMLLYVFETHKRTKETCLCILDEFPSLRHIAVISTAAPTLRSYQIRLVTVSQDLEALEASYPKTWGGFLGNASGILFMGSEHQETLEHFERRLGRTTRKRKIEGGWFSKTPARYDLRVDNLMDAAHLKIFTDPLMGNIILFRAGRDPVRLKNIPYYSTLPIWHYQPDPEHGDSLFRRLGRFLSRKYINVPLPPRRPIALLPPASGD